MASLVAVVLAVLAVIGATLALAVFLSPALRNYPAAWIERHLFPDPNQINLKNAHLKGGHMTGKVYRILAFGDSLTEGFTDGGNAFHPYAKRLGDLIYPQMPKGWHLEIEEQGESGERVLMGMTHRLQRTLDEHTAAQRLYDWVLLLGGINDLAGDGTNAQEVMDGLDVLVQKCLEHGANVMLMTLLEVAMPEPRVEQQRQQLNSLISEYVSQRKWDKAAAAGNSNGQQGTDTPKQGTVPAAVGGGPNGPNGPNGSNSPSSGSSSGRRQRSAPHVHLFDLGTALPFEGMKEEQRWEVWDDGVHLTMVGYDHMGGLVTAALMPLIHQELEALGPADGTTARPDKKAN